MTDEKWVSIDGYGDTYQISNNGRIKSLKDRNQPILLKTKPISSGELRVSLSKNGKSDSYDVGRLVAHYFVSNDNRSVTCCKAIHSNTIQLIYKDDNRSNVNYTNLKWSVIKSKPNMPTNIKGQYTEEVSFEECYPFIEQAIKAHSIILCHVYNSFEIPSTCEQAFVIAYNNNGNKRYICTNGFAYRNAIPVVKRYRMKSPNDIVKVLLKNKWTITNTGDWYNDDKRFSFTTSMFLYCNKDVVKKPNGKFYTVKGNHVLLEEWVDEK